MSSQTPERQRPPVLYELSDADCRGILERNRVGRIAFSHERQVDVEPISYVFHDEHIYGRMGPGTKLTMLAHSPWVAFQVDEIDGPFDWESVVVHGTVYRLHDEGTLEQRSTYADAVALLQRAFPGSLTAEDPVPERSVLFRINALERVGRGSRSA